MRKSYAERHGLVNNQQANDGKPRKKRELKASIDLVRQEMESLFKQKLITSDKLSEMVNSVFRAACPEYEGCNISVEGQGMITCDIFFTERAGDVSFGDGKIKILRRRDDKTDRSSYSIIEQYNNRNRIARVYELTDEGKDALSEFVSRNFFIGDRLQSNVDWKKCSAEVSESDWLQRSRIYMKVSIDIVRLLQKVYGHYNEDKEEYLYVISPVRPLVSFNTGGGNIYVSKWLFLINQLNNNVLNEVLDESVMRPQNVGSLNIYRG